MPIKTSGGQEATQEKDVKACTMVSLQMSKRGFKINECHCLYHCRMV